MGVLGDPEEVVAPADYYYPVSFGAFNHIYRILSNRSVYLHVILII
jgi:hypothetical protein